MSTAYQTSPAFILVCGFGIDFHQPPDQRHIESRGSMEAQEEALIMQEVLMNHRAISNDRPYRDRQLSVVRRLSAIMARVPRYAQFSFVLKSSWSFF